jgi:hypothetical protein
MGGAILSNMSEDGIFEYYGVNTLLREQLRIQLGRDPQPSAAIIDSQSVKTVEKGGLAAMMAASVSTGVNGISW